MIKQNKFIRLPSSCCFAPHDRFPRNDRRGFTMAEVFLTLTIMGILMAITIPTLMTSTNTASYVNGLKKSYGMLDTATNQIMINNSGTLINAFTDSTDAITEYGKVLEFNKTCVAGAVTDNCWTSSTKPLFGGAIQESFDADINYEGAVLADGMLLLFYISNPACDGAGVSLDLPYSSSVQTHLCGVIVVDVNGFNNPNQFGRDMFMFLLGSNGLYPGGDPHTIYNNQAVECDTTNGAKNGYGCAAKVLNAQAIDY